MYEELVKRLRSQCQGYSKECEDCNADGNCRSQMENEAADVIEELTRENKSLAKSVNEASDIFRRRWIPVTKRLPEKDTRVIVCASLPEGVHSDFIYEDGHWFVSTGVTHWMPFPEPPKEA